MGRLYFHCCNAVNNIFDKSGHICVSISHCFNLSMDYSHILRDELLGHCRMCVVSSILALHLGQFGINLFFHMCIIFPLAQQSDSNLVIQCCLLSGIDFIADSTALQSVAKKDASVKIFFLSTQYAAVCAPSIPSLR